MRITDEQLKHLRESFKQYDLNDDNQIDKHELLKILKDVGLPNPEKEVASVMQKLDSNNDGTISFAEFLKFLKTLTSIKEVEVDDIVGEIVKPHGTASETTPLLQQQQQTTTPPHPVHSSPHVFVWKYEGSNVELAGDFTQWGKNKLPMTRNADGHFYLEIYLTPGVYEYRFIIDNNFEWYYDIMLPNVLNTGSGFINNVITV